MGFVGFDSSIAIVIVVPKIGCSVKKKTPREIIKEHRKTINRSVRQIERERNKMLRDIEKAKREIKKEARQGGDRLSMRLIAKSIVQSKSYVRKMRVSQSRLKAVGIQLGMIVPQLEIQKEMIASTRAPEEIRSHKVAGVKYVGK